MSLLPEAARREAFAEASRFRGDFYECLTARRDELFELVDAVLCADGAVKSAVDLTLLPEHRRGHGECRSRRYESAPHRSGRSGHKDAPLGERGVFREHHCSSAPAAHPPSVPRTTATPTPIHTSRSTAASRAPYPDMADSTIATKCDIKPNRSG